MTCNTFSAIDNSVALAHRQCISLRRVTPVLLLLLLVTLTNVCTLTAAIHEDEQGVWDWVRRFVGNVKYASVQPIANPRHVFVTSEEGAVAAMSLSPGIGGSNLSWRQLFGSDTPRCLHAGKTAILAVTVSGTVYVLNPQTGAIEITFELELPNSENELSVMQLSHVTCVESNGKATIVAHLHDKAHVYSFSLDDNDNDDDEEEENNDNEVYKDEAPEEFIRPKQSFTIGTDVCQLLLTVEKSNTFKLWVNHRTTNNAACYNISKGNKLEEIAGHFVGAVNDVHMNVAGVPSSKLLNITAATFTKENSASTTTHSGNDKANTEKDDNVLMRTHSGYAVMRAEREHTNALSREMSLSMTCLQCVAISNVQSLRDTQTTGFTLLLWEEKSIMLLFPSNKSLSLPFIANAHAPQLLLAFTRNEEEFALVQTGSLDLLLVSSTRGLLWHRPEGVTDAVATILANYANHTDHLHVHQEVLFVSSRAVLYSSPLAEMGARVEPIIDFSATLLRELNISHMDEVHITKLTENASGYATVEVQHHNHHHNNLTIAHVQINYRTHEVVNVKVLRDVFFSGDGITVMQNLSVHGALPHRTHTEELEEEKQQHQHQQPSAAAAAVSHHDHDISFYTVNVSSGEVHGYLSSDHNAFHPSWTINVPSSIVAHTSGNIRSRTAIVNALHVYPNVTDGEPSDVVLQRYPMQNVIALAYYQYVEDELPTLVVMAIDAITGGILASTSHKNVEGAVHMIIAEHAIVYYFLDAHKMRYCFGVWELFEEVRHPVKKTDIATFQQMISSFFASRQRAFSSRASLPPMVESSVLGAYGGPLADMSLTTSQDAIARKSVVLAYKSGRVAIVELRQLFAGGQMPIPRRTDRQLTHVIIPSVLMATHRYRIAAPRYITTQPTQLESSCHVIVNGLDVFYVRSSSGKPFDVLNPDFNKPLLITLCVSFALVSLIARYVVMRKGLYVLWK